MRPIASDVAAGAVGLPCLQECDLHTSFVKGGDAPSPLAREERTALTARLSAALATILLLGLALRVGAARGELWLDEIWSLTLVAPLHSAGAVFWDLSHDNNHFLNSLWLYMAGPDRPALVYRLPAILFGTLSVLVAARIGLRRDVATGIVCALLAATSVPLVNYGSEARGYAGLILAILVAIDATEQALARRAIGVSGAADAGAARWFLAAAIGFGALSHLTMLSAVAVLGLAATLRLWRAGGGGVAMLDSLVWLFWPSALALVPTGVALAAGIMERDGFTMGGAEPFSLAHFLIGYGDMLRFTTGLPAALPAWAVLTIVATAVTLAARLGLLGRARWPLVAAALVVLPGIMAAARLPNLEYPRYFMVDGIVLMLALGEVMGRAWRRGGAWRTCGMVLLLFVVAGQAVPLAGLLVNGRGNYTAAVLHMGLRGQVTYASNAPFATRMVLDHVAPTLGIEATPIAVEACDDARPEWVIESSTTDVDAPPSLAVGPATCKAEYVFDSRYPSSALSGLTWTLYRRAD